MSVEVRQHALKGRCLYTTRLIPAGEPVLEEEPLLLLVSPEHAHSTCASCLRVIQGAGAVPCSQCCQACFCSVFCSQQAAATPWMHSSTICRAYQSIACSGLGVEDMATLRFLVHVLVLREVQASDPGQRFQKIWSLVGSLTAADLDTATRITPALTQAIGAASPAAVEELAALVRKEQLNGYGIMAAPGPDGQRSVRGSALYHMCALVNHECNPNTARFDSFDGASARMSLRAMHDLPSGSEVTQSYCPLNWSFVERQQQCREVYGFICNCPRCQAECLQRKAGHTDDGSDTESDGMEEDNQEGGGQPQDGAVVGGGGGGAAGEGLLELPPNAEEGPLDPTYIHLFLLKYVCPLPGCFGTLAPLPEEQQLAPGSLLFECNVCGGQRSEAEFLQELDQMNDENDP